MSGATAKFTILVDGLVVPIDLAATIKVQFFSVDGSSVLTRSRTLSSSEAGADWPNGVVGIALSTTEQQALTPPACMVVISGPDFVRRFKLDVESPGVIERSLLFIKDFVVDEMRSDRLILLAQTFFPDFTPTDDYIWEKIIVAENEVGRRLRVPLVPTQFFGNDPTPEQIAALPSGMPWAIDPPQDYDPDFFQGEKWGFMVLRWKPVIQVQQVRFAYPSPTTGFFDFPNDWLRIDKKYAQVRFVPASSTFVAPLNAFLLQALGGGRTIPFAFQVTYQAGINAREDYPQLIDVIKRVAALKMVEDSFIPNSASISADGLSQSLSVDMEKYRGAIEATLFGPKGSNGGLMTAIHGIRLGMLG